MDFKVNKGVLNTFGAVFLGLVVVAWAKRQSGEVGARANQFF